MLRSCHHLIVLKAQPFSKQDLRGFPMALVVSFSIAFAEASTRARCIQACLMLMSLGMAVENADRTPFLLAATSVRGDRLFSRLQVCIRTPLCLLFVVLHLCSSDMLERIGLDPRSSGACCKKCRKLLARASKRWSRVKSRESQCTSTVKLCTHIGMRNPACCLTIPAPTSPLTTNYGLLRSFPKKLSTTLVTVTACKASESWA